ncbi:MAG: hypothetical protein A3I91_00360 [Candidatus Kerfeldbacteria bacterium RIFCSPLOWO2_02_FULL_42_19]|nr:MAG: hypothetical protein A3E60_00745 [Candidatus Kerfeldbacteria bacterium RIFCSPHIGHO2_12_FULL_42_13]OGY84511.1 MAG: hypothetical protein A3I91_00360 [Candidatus Kerfeldbacteria bacterium RIFCSPLOWO2_02_FULL_42_19]OGY87618.1 MAG: hypothetical protein A3G01_02710 [Candidatus Kerfeldbacteria bacterium RIFCSPLOWO2_12_FULL_43_9]
MITARAMNNKFFIPFTVILVVFSAFFLLFVFLWNKDITAIFSRNRSEQQYVQQSILMNQLSPNSSSVQTGIFWRTNQKSNIAKFGGTYFLSGGRGAHFSWCEIEKTPGNYDFSTIDTYIHQWKQFDKKSIIAISAASSAETKTCALDEAHPNIHTVSPGWLFQTPYNVQFIDAPTKASTQKKSQKNQEDIIHDYWPIYWDPIFVDRFDKLYQALAKHLQETNLVQDVAWVEALHGRENSTSVTRDDIYLQYVEAFTSHTTLRKDFNDDQNINEKDFEIFWTNFLKQSIDHLTPALSSQGVKNMLVIVDFQTSSAKPSRYYEPFLTDIARYALKQGMLFGGKALNVEPNKMLRKPTIFIFASSEFLSVPKALWNDVTSIGQNTDTNNFQFNYANAIGDVRNIPLTHINYTYIAPEELSRIVATWPNDCPDLPKPSNAKNLCWPELEDVLRRLIPQLEPVKTQATQ